MMDEDDEEGERGSGFESMACGGYPIQAYE